MYVIHIVLSTGFYHREDITTLSEALTLAANNCPIGKTALVFNETTDEFYELSKS